MMSALLYLITPPASWDSAKKLSTSGLMQYPYQMSLGPPPQRIDIPWKGACLLNYNHLLPHFQRIPPNLEKNKKGQWLFTIVFTVTLIGSCEKFFPLLIILWLLDKPDGLQRKTSPTEEINGQNFSWALLQMIRK